MLVLHFLIKHEKKNKITLFFLYLLSCLIMIMNIYVNRSGIDEILTIGHGNPYAILESNSFMIRTNILFIIYSLIYVVLLNRYNWKKVGSSIF